MNTIEQLEFFSAPNIRALKEQVNEWLRWKKGCNCYSNQSNYTEIIDIQYSTNDSQHSVMIHYFK